MVVVGAHDRRGAALALERLTVRWTSYRRRDIRVTAPVDAATIYLWFWKERGPGHLYVDDVRLATSVDPVGAVARTAEERAAFLDAICRREDAHGYSLVPDCILHLRRRHNAARVRPGRILTIGGASSPAPSVDAALAGALGPGYAVVPATKALASCDTLAKMRGTVSRFVERHRPEVVRIWPGAAEAFSNTPWPQLALHIESVLQAVLEAGSIPVVHTASARAGEDGRPTDKRVSRYNDELRRAAWSLRVPFVDAHRILNAPGRTGRGRAPTARDEGLKAVDERFVELYRLLERWALGREPGGVGVERSRASAGAPARPAPGARDLLTNGGFEAYGPDARFAAAWLPQQTGRAGAQHSVLLDGTGPRSGKLAIVLEAIGDGAEPGVLTSQMVPRGRYVLSFWARTQRGATAAVVTHLDGTRLGPDRIADTWQQVSHPVVVEQARRRLQIAISARSPGVRVWLDDVGLRRAE
jgi:hypothetical protein